MRINDVQFNADLDTILNELVSQLRLNNIQYIQKMKPTPTDIQICCPYHSNGMERRPSAGIRRSDGKFHCFACNEVHTLPEVISFCFGHEDDLIGKFGWQWLLKNFATIQKEDRKRVELNLERYIATTKNMLVDNKKNIVTEEELDRYRYTHPYMYERKLTDEIIELFDIGYDPSTECITFPIRDADGDCLFVARRSVKTKFFNYPEGVEKPVYGLYELKQLDTYPKQVIICESMLDALTCWVYGKHAIALNGLGNDLQFKQLRNMPCRKFILATDMDERGINARKRIRERLRGTKIITEYLWEPRWAKDVNDMDFTGFQALQEFF